MTPTDLPTVSVLVCTYDRPDYLQRCLKSIRHQTFKNFEIVIVQGPPMCAGPNRTDEVIAAYKPQVKLGKIETHNVAAARNAALRLASGDLIAFIDDDAVAPANWLQSFVQEYQGRNVAGLGGFGRSFDGQIVSRVITCDRFAQALNHPSEQIANIKQRPGDAQCYSLTGYNALFERRAVLAVDGFDEVFAYMFEETDLCFRLMDHGYILGYSPQTWIMHGLAPGVDRDSNRLPANLYRRYLSLAYFCLKHGKQGAQQFVDEHQAKMNARIDKWVGDDLMTPAMAGTLREQMHAGAKDGTAGHGHLRPKNFSNPPPFYCFHGGETTS